MDLILLRWARLPRDPIELIGASVVALILFISIYLYWKWKSWKNLPKHLNKYENTVRLFVIYFIVGLSSCSGEAEGNVELEEVAIETDSTDKGEDVEISETSLIRCPTCGFSKDEELPTEVCLLKYNCDSCDYLMVPDSGDCCVFCTYGDHKCPSMQ